MTLPQQLLWQGCLRFRGKRVYTFLQQMLSDQKGGVVFTCFGIWHILYMIAIFGIEKDIAKQADILGHSSICALIL